MRLNSCLHDRRRGEGSKECHSAARAFVSLLLFHSTRLNLFAFFYYYFLGIHGRSAQVKWLLYHHFHKWHEKATAVLTNNELKWWKRQKERCRWRVESSHPTPHNSIDHWTPSLITPVKMAKAVRNILGCICNNNVWHHCKLNVYTTHETLNNNILT
jgi:hypothetical protein